MKNIKISYINKLLTSFFFIVVFILASHSTYGQTGTLSGRVLEKSTGKSLVGVNIYLKNNTTLGAVSDFNGYFSLELPVGKQLIYISYTGMKKQQRLVHIVKDSILWIKVEMQPVTYNFNEIVIRAGKFSKDIERQTVSVDVMKPRIINAKNTTNISTILDMNPGVTILDQEPQIRGGSGYTYGVGSKVAVFVDDIPIMSATAGKIDWSFIPIENINQIEVIKGASSVLAGASALSGAIYVRLKYPGLKPHTYVNTYLASYSAPKAPAGKWWSGPAPQTGISFSHSRRLGDGNTDFVIGGMFNYDYGYQGPPVIKPPVVDSSNLTNHDMQNRMGRVNLNIRRRSKKVEGLNFGLNTNFMWDKSATAMAWLDDTTGFYRGYPGAILMNSGFTFYADPFLNYYSKNGARHEFLNRIMYSKSNANLDQSDQWMMIYNKYELRRQFKKLGNLDFITGAVSNYGISHANMFQSSGTSDNHIWNLSWYLQMEKNYGKIFNFSIGIRTEYYKLNNLNAFKPIFRFGTSFKVSQGTFLRASFGQGYRFPTIAERYVRTKVGTFGVFDNPDLKPEESWNAEAGIKQGLKMNKLIGYLDLAFFYQNYKNTVEYLFGFWDPSFAFAGFKFVNSGKSRITGIDFSFQGKADFSPKTTLYVLCGYTYVKPVAIDPDYVFAHDKNPGGQNDFSYNTSSVNPESRILKYRFLHTAKLDLQLDIHHFTMGTSMKYFSKIVNLDKAIFDFEDATRATGGTLQAILYRNYFYKHNKGNMIWDIRFGYHLSKASKVAILGTNIFNKMYSLRPLKAEPMRNIMLQYSLNL